MFAYFKSLVSKGVRWIARRREPDNDEPPPFRPKALPVEVMAMILAQSDLKAMGESVFLQSQYHEICVKESLRVQAFAFDGELRRFRSFLAKPVEAQVKAKHYRGISPIEKARAPRALFFGRDCNIFSSFSVLDQCVNVENIGVTDYVFAALLNARRVARDLGLETSQLPPPAALAHGRTDLTVTVLKTLDGWSVLRRAIEDNRVHGPSFSRVVRLVLPKSLLLREHLQAFFRLTHLALSVSAHDALTSEPSPLELLPQLQALVYLFPHGESNSNSRQPTQKSFFEGEIFRRFIFEDRRNLALQTTSDESVVSKSEIQEDWKGWAFGEDLWQRARNYTMWETMHLLNEVIIEDDETLEKFLSSAAINAPFDPLVPQTTIYSLIRSIRLGPSVIDIDSAKSLLDRASNIACVAIYEHHLDIFHGRDIFELILLGPIDIPALVADPQFHCIRRLALPIDIAGFEPYDCLGLPNLQSAVFYDPNCRLGFDDEEARTHIDSTPEVQHKVLLHHIFQDRRLQVLHSCQKAYAWSYPSRNEPAPAETMWIDAKDYTARVSHDLCTERLDISMQEELSVLLGFNKMVVNTPLHAAASDTPATLVTNLCLSAEVGDVGSLDDLLALLPCLSRVAISSRHFRHLFERGRNPFKLAQTGSDSTSASAVTRRFQLIVLDELPKTRLWPDYPLSQDASCISHLVLAALIPDTVRFNWRVFPGTQFLALPMASLVDSHATIITGLPHLRSISAILFPCLPSSDYIRQLRGETLVRHKEGYLWWGLQRCAINSVQQPQRISEYFNMFQQSE